MKTSPLLPVIVLAAACAGCEAPVAGDPARGAKLHEACIGCHGTELYVPPAAKVKDLAGLKKAVDEWNDRMNPKFDDQEVADIVSYLDSQFYRFR